MPYVQFRLNLQKSFGINKYFKRLPYISNNNNLAFQNSIIDVNKRDNREELQTFLRATNDFGENILENVNTGVTDRKLKN